MGVEGNRVVIVVGVRVGVIVCVVLESPFVVVSEGGRVGRVGG